MPIGETLAEARRARGLSVDDVAAQTRIRGTVIREIESDQFEICGGAVYARGHIRSIGRVVGVDPEPLVEEFDRENGGPPGGAAAPLSVTPFDPEAEQVSRRRRPNWTAAAVVSLLVIIGFAAAALVTGNHPNNSGNDRALNSPSPSAAPTSSPSPRPAPPPSSAVASAGVSVVVKVTSGDSWFSVKNSAGNFLFEGLLYAGQRKLFTDPTLLSLVIGNAPVVDLVVNGHDLGSPAGQNDVARVSYGPGNPSATAAAG